MTERMQAGQPYPIGPRVDARGANFALFSAHAEKVELCLFDDHGRREIERIALPENSDPELEELMKKWRADKPYDPRKGM